MKTDYPDAAGVSGAGSRFAIVVGEWYREHSLHMVNEARAILTGANVRPEDIELFWSPGSFEIPVICRALCNSRKFDAILAFGIIVQGQTRHFDMLVTGVTQGLMTLMTATGIPIMNEILAAENLDHVIERTKPGPSNKGREAALAALKAVALIKRIEGR